MPRPQASPEQHTVAYHLYNEGKGPKVIYDALDETYGNEAVSERTVATWVKGFKALTPEVVNLDSAFQWHMMDQYGLPWEAGDCLMEVLYLHGRYREHILRRFLLPASAPSPEAEVGVEEAQRIKSTWESRISIIRELKGIAMPFSFREAIWCWRIHQAAPEIGASVGALWDVYYLARRFVARGIVRDVLGKAEEVADLEALLVYKPWLDFGGEEVRHQAYHRAVDEGAVVPLVFSTEEWIRSSTKASLALALGLNLREVTNVIATPFFCDEHPELLMSQQAELEIQTRKESE